MKAVVILERIFRSPVWKLLAVLVTAVLVFAVARLLWGIYYAPGTMLGLGLPANSQVAPYAEEIWSWGIAAALMLFLIVVAGVVDLWLGWVAARQFRDVVRAIEGFAEGSWEQRIEVGQQGNPDIVRLGRVFNLMADRISGMIEQIKERDQNRRELVAEVAHDLGTPTTSIQGYAETLLMKDFDERARRSYLKVILSNARIVARLVRELFELARLDDPEWKLKEEAFSVEALAGDVMSRYAPLAEEHQVKITMESFGGVELVWADIDLIERALSNLIENAIKFAGHGGEVKIVFSRCPSGVEVRVRNSGGGVDESERERIFKRYYRGHDTLGLKCSGSGLGLSIVKRIVELHGSMVEFKNLGGEGVEVCFNLKWKC